jgi:hypothetical protein
MQQPESTADHRVSDLADRERTRHRARPPQSQQPVGAGELVDGGLALDTGHSAPERQNLRVAQNVADAPAHDQPLAERAAIRLHLRRTLGRENHRPLGQQMPWALAGLRVRRILVVDRQLVADLPRSDQLALRGEIRQRAHPTAVHRVDRKTVMLVLDRVASQRFPASRPRTRRQSVGLPSQRGQIAYQPAHRPTSVVDLRR